MGELKLMKGNEALAEAAIRAGVDGYFGYPITPQSEVIEYLMAEKPHERNGDGCFAGGKRSGFH